MSYDDYLERQRADYENILEVPSHYAEIEFEDPDEGGMWWMRVECLGDHFANFVILSAKRDNEQSIKQYPELDALAKRLETWIEDELERQWRQKTRHYDE
jgi:hypothetical protein